MINNIETKDLAKKRKRRFMEMWLPFGDAKDWRLKG